MRVLAAAVVAALVASAQTTAPPPLQLVIVVDGLRPDLVTAAAMPRLTAIAKRGTVFTAHHSVFPTVTRLNGASFVTGTYPETHGLLGNTVYIPSADPLRGLDTGRRENLERIAAAEGRLLTAPTLSEIFKDARKTFVALGSGTSGAVFVLNDRVATGAVVHPDYALPADLHARIVSRFGAPPAAATPNIAQHRRVVDVFLQMTLADMRPDVAWIWLNDPDATGHARGLGAAPTRESLTLVDGEIGRIEDGLAAVNRLERTNIIVTSDHGFSTHTGALRLGALVEPFARKMPDGTSDIVVAEGAIHFRGARDPERIAAVVAALQKRPEVGAIFTRSRTNGGSEGSVAGTLSYDVARWNHARSGDILVSANWSDEANDAGIKGKTTQSSNAAGHGTSSPYDVHNTLIAAGPDFRNGATSDVPTANVDIAPTLLRLAGLPAAASMTGRVIEEGLRAGNPARRISSTHETITVRNGDGTYELRAHVSTAAGKHYLDYTEVIRR